MSLESLERALPAGDRILVETSVLIAYLNGGEPIFPAAVHLLDTFIHAGRNLGIVSTVSAMEILVRPLRLGPGEQYEYVLDFLTHFPHLRTVSIDLAVAQEAASLRATYRLTAPDALIVATGLVSQVSHLVTNDEAWLTKLRPLASRIQVCYLSEHLPFP